MAKENDFTQAIVNALGKRTNFTCSYPGCTAEIFGPSAESTFASSYLGTAAHIVAAGKGPSARRVDPDMSDEDKRSIDNGIFMCRNHGKLIDDDEDTHTIETLISWKKINYMGTEPHTFHKINWAPSLYRGQVWVAIGFLVWCRFLQQKVRDHESHLSWCSS